jgi:hypothetical protein
VLICNDKIEREIAAMKKITGLLVLLIFILSLQGCANGRSEGCPYCGDLAGGNRWFIAKVTDDHMVMPLCIDCFEANAAGDAGISLNVEDYKVGDIVRITYGGYIMESYPVQISPISVERADIDQ